ncbi:MAG: hypothetical protein OQK27_02080 [Gammaproteobacteria bacterium]|nr:hypothetical protein [Gammaproteobacteria bacterium]MCW9058604.1 hypothetical protein [Gammaproteobacteria bacterium]
MHALDTTLQRCAPHSLAHDELPGFRPRYLGLSEAEFLALSCGHHTRRLKTGWLHGAMQRCCGRGFYAARLEEAILLHNETCTLHLPPQAAHAPWIVRKPTYAAGINLVWC